MRLLVVFDHRQVDSIREVYFEVADRVNFYVYHETGTPSDTVLLKGFDLITNRHSFLKRANLAKNPILFGDGWTGK